MGKPSDSFGDWVATFVKDEKPKDAWQLCPKCEGSGMAMNFSNNVPMTTDTCDVCNGKKIISIQTGLPPT